MPRDLTILAARCFRCHAPLDDDIARMGCRVCIRCLKAKRLSASLNQIFIRHATWLQRWDSSDFNRRIVLDDCEILAIGCKAPVKYRRAANDGRRWAKVNSLKPGKFLPGFLMRTE